AGGGWILDRRAHGFARRVQNGSQQSLIELSSMATCAIETQDEAIATKDESSQLRWSVYWLLITVSAAGMIGRILSVDSVDRLSQQSQLADRGDHRNIMRPFLSANDRSRWCTIRSLVEFGT